MHFQRRKQRHREVEILTQRLPSQEGAELRLSHVHCNKNKVSIDRAAQKVPGRQGQCFV